jgi:tight adherence protein B
VPLEVSVGDASAGLAYAVGGVRAGSTALAPITDDGGGGGGFLTSSLVKWLIVLLGVVAAVMLVLGVGAIILSGENSLTKRLEVYDESFGVDAALEEDESSNVSVPIIKRAVEFTGDMAERRGVLDKVESKLERANLPLRAAEAMFFTFALAAVSVALVYFLTGSPVIALAVAVLGALLPLGVLDFKIRSRQKAFVQQLPDMLGLLAGTLKAGYSIGQGFEAVSGEIDDPMGRELRRVMTETRLGRSLEESLEGVAERMDSDDFAWAVMAIRIQREVGGNLAELLMTVADTMTQRERLRREVSTLTAEGKMSAIIIGALPPGLCMVMFVMNPDYIGELFTPGLGYGLIAGAVLMLVIGFAWMKKTITIEV